MKHIAPDKWKHFFVGLAMGLVFQLAFWYLLPLHHVIATAAALLAVTIISYGFELFSKYTGKGHYELMDAVAAIIGGLLGMGTGLIVIGQW